MKSKNAAHRRTGFGVFALFATLLISLTGTPAWADYRDQAKRIYDRIAGVPPDDATITTMAGLVAALSGLVLLAGMDRFIWEARDHAQPQHLAVE